jgi:histidinol-phosphate phosphatase family protein
MARAVFLDRDGVINKEVDLLTKKEQVKILDGSDKAIKLFNKLGLRVIVVTNQPQVARGLIKEEDVRIINKEISEELARMDAHIDAFYFCPHHP